MASKFQHGGIIEGSADVTTTVVLRDSSDSTGKTGIAYGSVTATYWRQGGTVQTVTMASLTNLNDPHSDGGWKEVNATNRPGEYRIDWPDAAFASGADWVELAVKVANCFLFYERFPLVPANPYTDVKCWNGTAVSVGTTSGLPKVDAQAISDSATAANNIEANIGNLDAAVSTRSTLSAQNARDAMKLAPSGGAPAGGSVDGHLDDIDAKTTNLPADPADQSLIIAATNAIETDTQDIQSRLPAALVSGRMDSSVGELTTAAIKSIWDQLTSALTTAGSIGKRIVDYLDAAITSRSTFDPSTTPVEIRATGGTAGKNAEELVDDIWDEDVDTSHQTAGSAGKKLDDAGAAADPWATALPGSYGEGTAGKLLADVESKTTNLPPDPADQSLIIAATDAIVTDTQDIQSRLPAALVGGRMDSSVGALTTAAIKSIWDQLTSALTTAGSIGKKLADWVLGTDNMVKVSANAHTSGQTVAAVAGAVNSVTSGVNVTQMEGKTLDAKVGDNFNYFFQNAGAATTKIVNDVGVAGSGLTPQQVRDAMKLAPTAGDPASGSVDEHLDDIVAGVATPDVLVDTTIASVTDQTHFTLTDGPADDDAILNQAIVFYDVTSNDSPSVRKVTDYVASTKTVTINAAPDFTVATSDKVKVFVTAQGTTAPTAAENADAVLTELIADHKATSGSLADVVNRVRAATIGKKIVSDKANGTIKVYDEDGSTLLATQTIQDGATDDEVELVRA